MHLDFDKNRWSVLYETYARFCKGYYGYEYLEPSLTVTSFLHNSPFVIIDCSRQNESVKSATVDAVHGTEEDDADDDDDDDDSDAVVYVKGHEKRQWLWNLLLDDERVYIETLDADYENVDSLNNLDADNTMRCGYHYTNCALQNVFKLFNWWSDNHE
ncbi:hypothetical protein P5V15_011438 [Pogonomyrmex californicus]